jgi:uncharacterized protein
MPAFTETVVLDAAMLADKQTALHETKDGYVVCMPRVARTGIQLYSGAEVGKPEMAQVRVYRPEGEVFSRDAVRTLAGKPVTLEHPDTMVTADNWRDLAVGHLGDEVMRDGEFIRVPLHLMDASAIAAVKDGKTQLSVGYTASLEWGDGVTPSGEAYNVKQTGIRANHVAITHTARGGPLLRMGDKAGDKQMRTILIDGISVSMEDRDAMMVERHITKLEKEVTDSKTALATAQTQHQNDIATVRTEVSNATAVVGTKDAEITTLKQQLADSKLTPQKLDKLVSDRANTMQRARNIIGDALVVEGKTDADIRRQVVASKLGDVAKDWTDDQVTASFNTLTVTDNNGTNSLGQVVHIVQNAENFGNVDVREKAYGDYAKGLSERWKTAGHRTAS